jgi:ABC-type branched-subunit amino acid transport system ATPase component
MLRGINKKEVNRLYEEIQLISAGDSYSILVNEELSAIFISLKMILILKNGRVY